MTEAGTTPDLPRVFIVSGVPGAGQATLARALLDRSDRGFLISLDDLREWVVSGLAQPLPEWTEEILLERMADDGSWLTIDSSELSAGETVDLILEHANRRSG